MKKQGKLKVISLNAALLCLSVGLATGVYYVIPAEQEVVAEEAPIIIEEKSEEMTLSNLCLTAESVEKDLTVYVSDAMNETLEGEAFSVKLVRTGDVCAENEENLNEERSDLKEHLSSYLNGKDEDNETYVIENDAYAALCQTYEAYLGEKEGSVFTDEDKDGVIYAKDLEPGFYHIYYMPNESYFPDEPIIGSEVKANIEYTVVKEIEKKVETYDSSKDVKKHAIATEAKVTNTVGFVESKTEKSDGIYAKAVPKVTVGANGKTVSITSDKGMALGQISASAAKLYSVSGLNAVSVSTTVNTGTLTVNSKNDAVATAQVSGNKISIEAVAPGTATINYTLKYTEDGAEQIVSGQAVNVTVGSGNEPLLDASGNALYTDQGKTPATIAQYNPNSTYYYAAKEEVVQYYGWQTIDGSRYYYDKNGKPVTGEQTINGIIYNFASDGKLVENLGAGVDVSKWQGTIDWKKVKQSGINFAIIRCGGRYQSSRALYKDPMFAQNMSGASAAGIKVGIYLYSTAMTEAEAVEEASLAASMAKGYAVSLPIFIDMEDAPTQGTLSNAQRTAIATAFCQTIKSAGYTPGVYASYNWWTTKLNASALSKYRVWIARYNKTLGYSGKCDIWQYSSTGTVPGINGAVDVNKAYY